MRTICCLALMLLVLCGGTVRAVGPSRPENISDTKKVEDVSQIVCTWQKSVDFPPDAVQGGAPMAGLKGRLYLFGPDLSDPNFGDGGIVVDLFDESSGKPYLTERWIIDPEPLKRLQKKDLIGDGYTVSLPWSGYRPDISKIRLRTMYQGVKGAPIYTENVVNLADRQGLSRDGSGGAGKQAPMSRMPE